MVAAQGIQAPLPTEIETRLEKFAELTATAIANAQAREDLAAHARGSWRRLMPSAGA